MQTIHIFTDGSAKGNPGPGGYGAIIRTELGEREIACGYRLTTNNRMELMAAIAALELISGSNVKIVLQSDSKYLVDAFNKNWLASWANNDWKKSDGKPIANLDLWQALYDLTRYRIIEFKWVKGHAGHPENERCDELATAAADQPYEKLYDDCGFADASIETKPADKPASVLSKLEAMLDELLCDHSLRGMMLSDAMSRRNLSKYDILVMVADEYDRHGFEDGARACINKVIADLGR